MPKDMQPAADGADGANESFDGVRIEALAPGPSREPDQPDQGTRSNPDGSATAPGWTKRLSTRGKLARALIVALAVLVALLVLLPRSTFTLPPAIARLLTPAPTQTPLPGAFTSGPWEPVAGPPVPAGTYYELTASPVDPLTAYTCTLAVSADPTSPSSAHQVTVWSTHDAGVSWGQVSLPTISGTSCAVSPARDRSHRVTLSVIDDVLDQNAQACAHSQFFLSENDGATWRRIQHTSLAPPVSQYGFCTLWAVGRRLYLDTYVSNNDDQGRSFLERSDDAGLTWARADHGLEGVGTAWYAQPFESSGDTLGAFVDHYSNGALVNADLWVTRDAGVHWQHMGPVTTNASHTSTPVNVLVTEAGLGGAPKACRCVFALSYPHYAGHIIGQYVYTSHDSTSWTSLPPIPVKGTNALRSGIYDTLGITAEGKLLVLGAEPSEGVAAVPDQTGDFNGLPPRLWAWDTHTGRWELAETRVPCPDLQSCQFYPTGAAMVAGADGKTRGTTFWLTRVEGAGQSQPATFTFFRLFMPVD
jgi:hypothetical protein